MPRKRSATPRALQKSWHRTYEEQPYTELPWFSRSPFPAVRRAAAQKMFKSGARVLDIGCGAGTNALFLASSGYRVSGVDLAPGAVRAAQRRAEKAGLSVDFRVGDVMQLPFPSRTFLGLTDVGCFHTVPIRLRPAYAGEAARVLAPGGKFLLCWVAREYTRSFGPPHRPSVEEVARVFERQFLIRSTEFLPGRIGLPSYAAVLERRSGLQPPPR
jgi:ubiquinone/menaquinone biosynthesis C-methylase UbiE